MLGELTVMRMAAGAAASAGECSGTITAEEVLRAEDARYVAQTGRDFAALERMIGEDLVYIHSSSVVDTKASYIESMRSGTVNYRTMKRGETKVRTYGCIAIITGQAAFEVTARGQNLALDLRFHAVWAKRSAGVQFISWQATRLPPKE
jgi:hypothetical protein